MNKCGFVLIDTVTYAVLAALLSLFVFSFSYQTQQALQQTQSDMSAFIANTILLDVMRRELASIDVRSSVHDWARGVYRVQKLDVHGRAQAYDVGWRMHERGVMRMQGEYVMKTATWKSKTDSLILSTVKHIAFSPFMGSDGKMVKHVGIRLEGAIKGCYAGSSSKSSVLEDDVTMRNGVVA